MNSLLTSELRETLTNFKVHVWVCNPTHSAFPQSPKLISLPGLCLWQPYSHQLMIMIGIKRKTLNYILNFLGNNTEPLYFS